MFACNGCNTFRGGLCYDRQMFVCVMPVPECDPLSRGTMFCGGVLRTIHPREAVCFGFPERMRQLREKQEEELNRLRPFVESPTVRRWERLCRRWASKRG